MSTFLSYLAFLFLIVAEPVLTQAAALNLVATIPDLGALARDIGGTRVQVTVLAQPSEDPHFIDPRPSYAVILNRSDLVILNGLELESAWLTALLRQARNPDVLIGQKGYFDASSVIVPLEGGSADRAGGDVHPAGNPHYLLDPANGLSVAIALATRLEQLDPKGTPYYQANLTNLKNQLVDLDTRAQVIRARSLHIFAYHLSLSYLSHWLGLIPEGTVEPKPGIPPTPGHLIDLVNRQQQQPIALILQESYYPESSSRMLTKKIQSPLLILPGGAASGQSYSARLGLILDLVLQASGSQQ